MITVSMLDSPSGLEHRTQRVADQFPPNLNRYDSSHASPPTEVHQLTVQPDKDMSIECFMMCGDGCKSWTYNKSSSECLVYKDTPRMNGHNDNCSSGVKVHVLNATKLCTGDVYLFYGYSFNCRPLED